jgi:hypothetical protein
VHPLEQVLGPPQPVPALAVRGRPAVPAAGEHRVARSGRLVEQLLEPQLVDLVDRDEQQLVVGGRVRLETLRGQELLDPEVAAVGQPGTLLPELRLRVVDTAPLARHGMLCHPSRVTTRTAGYGGSMRIRHELRYDAPPGEVYAMLCDPAFRTEVCRALDVVHEEVSVEPTATGVDVRIDMAQRTIGIPAFARKVVGDETRVIQSERWQAARGADLQVEIPGKPGHIRGRITLAAEGRGTVESFDGEATIKVPLVGGRLEGLIERLFIAGMDAEQAVGARWLARSSS